MKKVNDIIQDVKKGNIKPVYVFDGEESYYIDFLTDFFENNILQESEKDFNFSVFYGKDADWTQIVNECQSYPAFAARRLVILKEATQLKDFARLESYFANPSATTILVVAHKYKKLDGRTSIKKTIAKHGEVITFDKLKDHEVSDWILNYSMSKNIKLSSRNADLLFTYLGNDLQKIANELQKVVININQGDEITEELIEKYIGISKDYNVFQYPKAIIERNHVMAFTIANYYMANPKDNPLVVITSMLYAEFNKLYKYHFVKHLPSGEAASKLKLSPYFLKDYEKGAKLYNLNQTISAINIIAEYNLNSIGINVPNNSMTILKELTSKLLAL
jgi:DNA polymerase-3 subunit delta